MNWHELTHNCPYCKVHTRIVQIAVNSEGKLNVTRVCPRCGGKSEAPFNMEFLHKWAKYKDIQAFIERSELPHYSEEEKASDDVWLRALKIDPNPKLLKE
jgi:transcription elongation factor Elf1